MSKDSESSFYKKLGASSSKAGILNAVGAGSPSHFIELSADIARDKEYSSFIHADGAGTKSILAYIAYRHINDLSYFRGLAQDALVMNLDDVLCVGMPDSLIFSNTIGRNGNHVPDSAIAEVIGGYKDIFKLLESNGIEIHSGGGETADVGDVVRTLLIDATLCGRIKNRAVISTDNITPGDVIIGLASSGKASYENAINSGISSNGLTLARHAMIPYSLAEKYPEILDPLTPKDACYKGNEDIFENHQDLNGQPIIKALLSPTRTYAPILKKLFNEIDTKEIHGIINCTGGGQTKAIRFGKSVRYIKNNLFTPPPIFTLIQKSMNIPWNEMYSVFNMGHRLEIVCPENMAEKINLIANAFNVESKIVGRVEKTTGLNEVVLETAYGNFKY